MGAKRGHTKTDETRSRIAMAMRQYHQQRREANGKTRSLEVWSIVDEDGQFVICVDTPLIWSRRRDAQDCLENGQRIVRATITVNVTNTPPATP